MTKNSSLLYFPNPLTGFAFFVETEGGEIYSIMKVGTTTNFTLEEETLITRVGIRVSANKEFHLYMRPTLTAFGSNVNRITYPYVDEQKTLNGIKFVPHSINSITINGKSTADALFTFNTNLTLQAGRYSLSLGPYKDTHWDVCFNHKDYGFTFHNKLFAQNDYCDGYIWEKYHEPNDYMLYLDTGYDNFIIYPRDKYAIRDNSGVFSHKTIDNLKKQIYGFYRGGRSKDLVILVDNYSYSGQNSTYLVSKNGKDWKSTPGVQIGAKGRVDNWMHNCNKGIIARHPDGQSMPNYFYADVDERGSIAFSGLSLTGTNYLIGEGGGRIFYVKDTFSPGTSQRVYAIDAKDRVEYETGFENRQNRFIYQMLNVGEWSHILSKLDDQFVWFIWSSNDGFRTMTEINSLMIPVFPNYGLDTKLAYFEDASGNPHYRILVTRYSNSTESATQRIACDIYDFGDSYSNQPTRYQDVAQNFDSQLVGDALTSATAATQNIEYAQYRNYLNNSFACGGYYEYLPDYRRLQWQDLFWSDLASRNLFYFKEGALSYPYEFMCLKQGSNILCVMEADGIDPPKDSFSFYSPGQIYLDCKNRSWNRRG